ncbi:MAG TPA: hypothetical protein VGU61_19025 [Noviherbaspirillum sp.]|uniref:hypothetical protein n=1 Tax=Noviherbaspirillum sp. TaxID=1926288 RepID=UPI002DDD03B9|nr:hypothetical protein [Noviherbaspirillum sp.]HEV2612363.1 hypothetical protein [Noviherbaspirillum sp.]
MHRYKRYINCGLAVLCVVASTAVHSAESAEPAAGWAANYPSGSIKSLDAADRALQEASQERARIQERFISEEQACFGLFFANACRDKAAERRRVALSAARAVEVQANAFKRKARVAERDKVLEEKSAAQQMEIHRPTPPDGALVDVAIPPSETTAQPSVDSVDKRGDGEAAVQRSSTPTRAKMTHGEDRSRQIAAYEKKVREAEEHKREVAQRKAEKQAKRQGKQTPAPAPVE